MKRKKLRHRLKLSRKKANESSSSNSDDSSGSSSNSEDSNSEDEEEDESGTSEESSSDGTGDSEDESGTSGSSDNSDQEVKVRLLSPIFVDTLLLTYHTIMFQEASKKKQKKSRGKGKIDTKKASNPMAQGQTIPEAGSMTSADPFSRPLPPSRLQGVAQSGQTGLNQTSSATNEGAVFKSNYPNVFGGGSSNISQNSATNPKKAMVDFKSLETFEV